MIYTFGNVTLHEDRRELQLDDANVQVEPRVFEVLLYLIRNRQRVVTRDELLDACWPGIYVSDGTLSRCLSRVRLAIGQPRTANEPIVTLYKKGYRFVAAVTEIAESGADETPELSSDGGPQPAAPLATRDPERRFITLAAGGFSASDARGANPEWLHEAITSALADAKDTLARHGGTLSRAMGGSFTIQFGYPLSNERAAEASVLCAQTLCRRAREFGLDARFGIASGWAIVDATASGTAQGSILVDIDPLRAENLRGLAAAGEVVADERTFNLVRDAFLPRQEGVIDGGPAFALIARAEPLREDDTIPFHGRDGELAHLDQLWGRVTKGRGQIVVVSGQAGVGKTSLVETFIRRRDLPSRVVLRGKGSPYQSLTPFYPLLTLIRQVIGIDPDTPPLRQLAAIEAALAHLHDSDADHLPLLASLLAPSTSQSQRARLNLDPGRQRERTLAALQRLLRSLVEDEPAMIWIDDVQWSDPSSVALLDQLAANIGDIQLLLVLSGRAAPALSETAMKAAVAIPVKPFNHRQTLDFLERCSGEGHVSQGQIEPIAARSDGVPLFIQEFIRAARHDGANAPEAAIPDSLQSLLQARLDQASDVRNVAQWAAVLGREFRKDVLLKASGLPGEELDSGLARLMERNLIEANRFGDGQVFGFAHGLLCDAAYDSMLASQRTERHRRVAETLAEDFPDIAKRDPELVARHFDASDTPERAAAFWRQAGNASAAQDTTQEARAQYSNALASIRQGGAEQDNSAIVEEIEAILAAIE